MFHHLELNEYYIFHRVNRDGPVIPDDGVGSRLLGVLASVCDRLAKGFLVCSKSSMALIVSKVVEQ